MTEASDSSPKAGDTSVLVVGGGPAGLALSIELARLGVAATLIEARDGAIDTPKMSFVNVRTMEFCRRWGLADVVRKAGHPDTFHPNVIWATSVMGYVLARLDFPSELEEKSRFYSPAADCRISQLRFDPILLAHARQQQTLTLRYRTRLNAFRETPHGIEATVTDLVSGRDDTIRASYIVGCDGAQSAVRNILGINLEGLPSIQNNFHIFFESKELIEIFERRLGQIRRCNLVGFRGSWGIIMSIDWNGLWRFSMNPPPRDETELPAILRRAVGGDFTFNILNSSHWVSRELLANAYGKGRAFLVGDAAHQNPPSGGFGMNTAIGDAIDLAWKLWAVLSGWGGPRLLDSYEAERRPVAKRNAQEATQNLLSRRELKYGPAIGENTEEGEKQRAAFRQSLADTDALRYHETTDGIALGYRYDPSPIICPDGTPAPPVSATKYIPTARPGHRAPHAWIAGGPPLSGTRPPHGRSTLDLYGDGFVLLCFGEHEEANALKSAADERKAPLKVKQISDGEIAKLHEARLVLVRPDGHVAWRGNRSPADAGAIMDHVRGAG